MDVSSQVTVTEVVYLGYEQAQRAGRPQALVRTVGRICEFHPRTPTLTVVGCFAD